MDRRKFLKLTAAAPAVGTASVVAHVQNDEPTWMKFGMKRDADGTVWGFVNGERVKMCEPDENEWSIETRAKVYEIDWWRVAGRRE